MCGYDQYAIKYCGNDCVIMIAIRNPWGRGLFSSFTIASANDQRMEVSMSYNYNNDILSYWWRYGSSLSWFFLTNPDPGFTQDTDPAFPDFFFKNPDPGFTPDTDPAFPDFFTNPDPGCTPDTDPAFPDFF